MTARERRRHKRVRAQGLAAHVRALDRSFTCVVADLSEGGVFLATEEGLPPGSIVALDLVKPGALKGVRIVGIVVPGTAPEPGSAAPVRQGMGIQFAQPGPEARAQIVALLGEMAGRDGHSTAASAAPGAGCVPRPARALQAIVTPFAGEARGGPSAQAGGEAERLREQVQALLVERAEAQRERAKRETELQALRAQLVAAQEEIRRRGR